MYVKKWETLSRAVSRVVEAARLPEEQAKHQICDAISDGAISIRAEVDPRDRNLPGKTLSGRYIKPPPHLRPEDLDWDRSRPRGAWETGPVGPAAYAAMGWGWSARKLTVVELLTKDVTRVLCYERPAAPADAPLVAAHDERLVAIRAAGKERLRQIIAGSSGTKPQPSEVNEQQVTRSATKEASEQKSATRKRSNGRPSRYNWAPRVTALQEKLVDDGLPVSGDGTQASMEQWMAGQFPLDECPSESRIRAVVSQQIEIRRRELEGQ